MYTAKKEIKEEVKLKIPVPKGYKLLISIPKMADKTEGGVHMPDNLIKAEETASIIGFVVDLGEEAYKDASKFPNGAYCQKGDFVIFRSYSGTRFKIKGEEFRLINDDTVEAVVDDPRGYARV